ncbi:tetratricopeptide repeat protein [Streptomyces sp. MAR4 CNX-425]|uniref:tetratricopeptide repeat protein n=1 Tax=Streptomyces sp. MAR4 CNX-425 TaxID=3406343 RepID=UPI003B5091A4
MSTREEEPVVRTGPAPDAAAGGDGGGEPGGEPGAGSGRDSGGDSGRDSGASAARTLRTALLVARVRTAVRAGELDEALRLLRAADARDVAERRDLLDLFARVHAQRGELDAAASYWRRVRTRHPDDPAAAAGLARLDRLNRRGPRASLARHRTRTAAVAAVCAAAALATGAVGAVALVDDGDPAAGPAAAAAPAAGQIEERVRKELADAAESARTREAARRAEAARDLARTLRSPGVRARARDAAVEVAFTDGVFSTGAELTPAGTARLAALGADLTALDAGIAVHGHAATVPGAPRRGGSVVALWRALVAARELSAASGKPLTAFTTASADQREAPYAEDAKNRTVTVVITPR